MNLALVHARAVWRTHIENACGPDQADEIQSRHASIVVDYAGDADALRSAGMRTEYDAGGTVYGSIAFADVERLDAVPEVRAIRLIPKLHPHLDTTVREIRTPWKVAPLELPGRGRDVIVALVDSGIDIFHESFRKTDATKSTRILELWDFTQTSGGSDPPSGTTGRLFTRAQIDAALLANPDAFPSRDKGGHGTHVAGIAAGNGSQNDRFSLPGHYTGVAPEADLVVARVTDADQPEKLVPGALAWCAEAGRRHKKADGTEKAVVINASFGTDTGAHDGRDVFDKAVNDAVWPSGEASPRKGVAVVVAAGNAGDKDIHEQGTVAPNITESQRFFVPALVKNSVELGIWYTRAAALEIEIIPPTSDELGPTTTDFIPVGGGVKGVTKTLGRTMELEITSGPRDGHSDVQCILVTFTPKSQDNTIRFGTWTINLRNTSGTLAMWDAWFDIGYKEFPTFRLPGESAFLPRRQWNTVSPPGTARHAITVGNYSDETGRIALGSSRGQPNQFGVDPELLKPTIAAPGLKVFSARSASAKENTCCTDQLVTVKGGTSMSAPHVTGVVALMFERNPRLTFEEVRKILVSTARTDGIPPAELAAKNIWGAGKLDALAAVRATTPAAGGGG